MNTANPYESPAPNSESHSWRRIDFFAAGLWIAIPIAVLVGRKLVLPMLDDFGVERPDSSQYVLSFWSPVLLAIPSLIVLLAMFTVPYGTTRRRFIWLVAICGMLVGVICVLSMLVPLLSLWRDLS